MYFWATISVSTPQGAIPCGFVDVRLVRLPKAAAKATTGTPPGVRRLAVGDCQSATRMRDLFSFSDRE